MKQMIINKQNKQTKTNKHNIKIISTEVPREDLAFVRRLLPHSSDEYFYYNYFTSVQGFENFWVG